MASLSRELSQEFASCHPFSDLSWQGGGAGEEEVEGTVASCLRNAMLEASFKGTVAINESF